MEIVIRESRESDFEEIIKVEESAFGEDSVVNLTGRASF